MRICFFIINLKKVIQIQKHKKIYVLFCITIDVEKQNSITH